MALFGLLFFGGALVPTVTGIMLNSVPEHLRASANSFAQCAYNAIGYLPAPMFYGTVAKIVDDPKSNIPFIALLSTSLVSISMLAIAVHTKVKREDEGRGIQKIKKVSDREMYAGTGEMMDVGDGSSTPIIQEDIADKIGNGL
jgi:MFS family permease